MQKPFLVVPAIVQSRLVKWRNAWWKQRRGLTNVGCGPQQMSVSLGARYRYHYTSAS